MLTGHFIASRQGNVFVTQFGELTSDHAVLCLPSITEELNLSRAVVAKTAQKIAEQCPVYVLDYYGTGDSEGEFEQSDSQLWLEDIRAACLWLQHQGIKSISLWGIRFGALLALHAQEKISELVAIKHIVLWKPVTNGKQFAGQFLRIKQANAMISKNAEKINWRQYILEGNSTEVAGYLLTANMLSSLESLEFSAEVVPRAPVHWFELSATELTPLAKRVLDQWNATQTTSYTLACPMFWQVPEIFDLPELSSLTVKAISDE